MLQQAYHDLTHSGLPKENSQVVFLQKLLSLEPHDFIGPHSVSTQCFTKEWLSLLLQAFMASVLKDYGLVREAAALYGKAVALEPRAVSYALNWLHALELCNEPAKALEVLQWATL